MRAYVVTVDWRDRMFVPEVVGVYATEDLAREAQNDKMLKLQEDGYESEEDFYVWFEETYVIGM